MKKRTEAFLLLLHNIFLIIFLMEKHTQNSTKFQILLNKTKFRMFKEISFCKFLEYYSIMINSKFHSILPKTGQENGTETWLLAKKNT